MTAIRIRLKGKKVNYVSQVIRELTISNIVFLISTGLLFLESLKPLPHLQVSHSAAQEICLYHVDSLKQEEEHP